MNSALRLNFVLFALLFVVEAGAQTIALGERVPRIKKAVWLGDNIPAKSEFTIVEFVHSASTPCRQSVEQIGRIVDEHSNISLVLVTHQDEKFVDDWLKRCVTPRVGVVVGDVRIRTSYGVNYAPYIVVLNRKRKALWFGNPQQLDSRALDKIMMTTR
jgi:hypothetical protein